MALGHCANSLLSWIAGQRVGYLTPLQLLGGNQVANLTIKSRSRWSDVLLTVLTAGLVVPRTVTFQGVILQP